MSSEILLVSDLHFGALPDTDVAKFIAELERLGVSVVVISGDLTLTATPQQFDLVEKFFKKLKAMNVNIVLYSFKIKIKH